MEGQAQAQRHQMRRSTRGCAPNLLCEVSTVALSLHKSDGGERTRVGHQRSRVLSIGSMGTSVRETLAQAGARRVLINRDCSVIAGCRNRRVRVAPPEAQALFCRRRHQPKRPPLAKSRPGNPAPAVGPGMTLTTMLSTLAEPEAGNVKTILRSATALSEKELTTVSNPNEPGGRPISTPNTQQNGDSPPIPWNS
jgi:hypothetical protein